MTEGDKIQTTVKNVLERFPAVRFCSLFGSAARARLTPGSDVDIAVAADGPMSSEEQVELSLALSDSLHREVDLIDLHQVSGTILQQALSRGLIVLNQDKALYASLVKRLWYNQADVMPLNRRILEERLQKWTQ